MRAYILGLVTGVLFLLANRWPYVRSAYHGGGEGGMVLIWDFMIALSGKYKSEMCAN